MSTPNIPRDPFAEQRYRQATQIDARPAYLIPPTVATTLLITLFFGLFGLIPAVTHTTRATQMGQPTGKYWITFASVIGGYVLLWILLAAAASGGA